MQILGPHPRFSLLYFLAVLQACGILVPQPGIKPVPPAVEARTAREFSTPDFLKALMTPVGQYSLPFRFTEENGPKEVQVICHRDVCGQLEAE